MGDWVSMNENDFFSLCKILTNYNSMLQLSQNHVVALEL